MGDPGSTRSWRQGWEIQGVTEVGGRDGRSREHQKLGGLVWTVNSKKRSFHIAIN